MIAATSFAAEFEQLRPYLLRVAYSHLGSVRDAEDILQEAWLRLARVDHSEIRNLRAWLTTTVARLSIDALTSARARREQYVGTWLPEPVVSQPDVADRVTLDESVSMALLVVLESLSPPERSAFLLHDVFGYSFPEVARIVGRTPAATRQLATRARRRIEAERPRYETTPEEQRQVVEAFAAAASSGDIDRLVALLDPDVEFASDGGGLVPSVRVVPTGPGAIGELLAKMARHYVGRFDLAVADVNGAAGLVVTEPSMRTVVALTVAHGRIRAIHAIRNPDKLPWPPR